MAPSEPPRRNVYKTTEGGSYPCEKCGRPRTRAEGGIAFTVCDECWNKESARLAAKQNEIADMMAMRAEIEALKAERDRHEKRQQWDRNTIAFLKQSLASQSNALRSLNKGIHRLRRGRDNAIKRAKVAEEGAKLDQYQAEIARLEGLILADHDPSLDSSACCGRESIHAEARAIKARQGA